MILDSAGAPPDHARCARCDGRVTWVNGEENSGSDRLASVCYRHIRYALVGGESFRLALGRKLGLMEFPGIWGAKRMAKNQRLTQASWASRWRRACSGETKMGTSHGSNRFGAARLRLWALSPLSYTSAPSAYLDESRTRRGSCRFCPSFGAIAATSVRPRWTMVALADSYSSPKEPLDDTPHRPGCPQKIGRRLHFG